jgi:hypothetical protein
VRDSVAEAEPVHLHRFVSSFYRRRHGCDLLPEQTAVGGLAHFIIEPHA